MRQSDLREVYVDELKDIYSAETQLVKALPKMAKAAASLQEEKDTDVKLSDLADQIQVVSATEENEPTTRPARAKAARA